MELTRRQGVRILNAVAKAHSLSLSLDYQGYAQKLVEPNLYTSRLTRELAECETMLMHQMKVNHPKEVDVLRQEPYVVEREEGVVEQQFENDPEPEKKENAPGEGDEEIFPDESDDLR